jgi:EmrB/QacA subfamily drug resistance transporter
MDAVPTRNKWLILLAVTPGMFIALADATVMSIAIPSIIQKLGSSVTSVSWILNGYNLVLTVLFITMGRIADRYGHKLVFVLGLVVFAGSSLGCALSPTVSWIITFRVFQAVGAAGIVPTSLTLLLAAFPREQQGFASGLFGAVSTLSASLGPTLGGLLIQAGGWQWVFWFNLPMGALALALAASLVPRHGHVRDVRPIDYPGVLFITAGLFMLTLALLEANNWGWVSAPILALFAAAAATLALFVYWELRAAAPLFDLRLFRSRAFAAANAAMTTVDLAMMGTAFMLVIYLVALIDYTELRAAAAVTFVPAAGLLIAPFSGRLIDRIGPRLLALCGALISAAGLFALAALNRHASFGDVVWRTVTVGVGLGITLPSVTAAGMSSLPAAVKGVGSGLLNTSRQLGFLLGVAILVAVFSATVHIAVLHSVARGQVMVKRQPLLSQEWKQYIYRALEDARGIDATAGFGEIRKLVHPIAGVPVPPVGTTDAVALLGLKDELEGVFLDETARAFVWPFCTAAIAALLSLLPAALLQRRLHAEALVTEAAAQGP